MKRILILLLFLLLLSCKPVPSQKPEDPKTDKKQELSGAKKFFAEMEAKALSEPFRGIETENGKESGLFPIKSSGVSTVPIKKAAESFLSSLTQEQKQRTQFGIEDEEWRKWCNVDNGIYDRQGVSLKEMTEPQKKAAFHLMQVSLSAKGLQLSKDIMKTDQTLKELNNGDAAYDEELYLR